MESHSTDSNSRPIPDIKILKTTIFVNPFDEKQQAEEERKKKEKEKEDVKMEQFFFFVVGWGWGWEFSVFVGSVDLLGI